MTLRTFISSTIVALLALTTTYGQGKEDKSNTLRIMKKKYQQINDYKNYKTVIIDNSENFLGQNTDNGGELTGYYKDDSLKKIIEQVGLSTKVIKTEYYFDKNKLIFVYSTESRYRYIDSTQSFDYSNLENVFKRRYYFIDDKLIETVFSDKTDTPTKQKDAVYFLTSYKRYEKLLKTRRK